MSDITREEFASAVAATISSVHHLYREVTRLIEGLRDALSEEPGALIPVRGSAVGKSRLNPARFVVRDAYGALFKPVVSDEEVDAAEDDEEESDADADDGGQGRTRRPVELVADLPLLAVRMVLYDPRKQDGIEPQIQFGVMSDWRVGSDEATEGQRFILARAMLRRVPLSLGAAVGSGQARRLQANATVKRVEGTKHKKSKDLKLSYQLPVGVETVPLYSLDSPEELRTLANRVRTMWNDGAPLVGRDRDGTAWPAPIAMADERPPDSSYWDDMKITITAETGRAQLQWQCYEYGLPWEKDETNAVLEARLRKAGIKLPEEETLEEIDDMYKNGIQRVGNGGTVVPSHEPHMPTAKTSVSDPLRIAVVTPDGTQGRIGITLCPGKTDGTARFGPWARDLDLDLDVIQHWGATALISLIEDQEFDRLSVRGLGNAVENRHMEWWHLPIPDGSPPGPVFETAWGDAGEAMRDRLRSGFDVLIHCRGGLGRAGTIVARLLVELGMRPDEAVRRVRDARGPGAIETPAQEAHVLGCVPQASTDPSRTMESIRNRALGAFLGLAVGDAVGTTLEFSPRDEQPRLVDMVGGGPFELTPGAWTDDTALALALADSLAASEALDCRDVMDRFVGWRNTGDYSCTGRCFDIGKTTSQALDRYLQTGDPIAGSTDPRSAGNGSLMRLAPVALRFWNDRPQLVSTAAEQSRTTHAADEAVDACRAYAELLADAIAGRPRAALLAPRQFDGVPAVARVLAGSWRGRSRDTIRSSGYVIHTLEAAIWSVARTADFRGAVLLAANLADDADTVAAVTGQLAGALYGLTGIPETWRDRIVWKDRLLTAARRLLPESTGSIQRSR